MNYVLKSCESEESKRIGSFIPWHFLSCLKPFYVYDLRHLARERSKSTGRPRKHTDAQVQEIEETDRQEAVRLLTAFEREANRTPADHWVSDDL